MKGNAVAVVVIFAAWIAGAAIPVATPERDTRVVVTFHFHAARCDLRGSNRPAALKLVCV